MKLNNIYKIVILLLFVVLAGCGGGYVAEKWSHSNTEADWDIDSAVCLAKSEEKFTKEDLAEIAKRKRDHEEAKELQRAQASMHRSLNSPYADLFELFGSAITSIDTIESDYKEGKFSICVTEKGWKKN